ncbi:MAG: hypothetical protein V4677_11265 [Bacteroidota bacterium]
MKKIAIILIVLVSACTGNAQCTLTLTTNNYVICSGSSISLSASGATSYSWIPTSQTGNNVVVTPTANITYTVLGSTGACTGSATCNVFVNPLPGLSVTVINNDTICAGATVTLTANASSPVSYNWNNGSTFPSTILSPTVNTWYSVSATNPSTGCSESLASLIVVDTTCLVL